ncbi:MAG: McrB family protein [Flavobacterium sp.]
MTHKEINEGIKLICETSKIIQNCYESKQALADEINNAKKEDIEKCWNYYKDRSGVVVDVRKELFKLIREGNKVTVKLLDDLVSKYKEGKENQFRVYKNFYTIFYPAITFYGHNPLREFIKNFENKLIVDLELENKVKTTSFDFQGPRQQGSDRYWLAIYNKEQQNQSTGIQFFIDFHHGNMSYGVYKHSNRDYLKERVVVTPEAFNYDDLLVYFKTEVNDLINDLPKYDNITSIDLGNHNLYKVSHGTFKAKNKSHVIETLKENNWIILHESTGKDQSRSFKEDLHEGDYVYITLGSKELLGIAKIVSEEWDYVPYEIVDADGWMYREVEFIKAPVRKNPKDLKDSKNIFPSGNSTLTEIKFSQLEEANDKLFKPYFNVEFYNSEIVTNLENDQQKLNNVLKPLNQILYGPPGTGKTYNTVLEAAKIVTGNETITYDDALRVFNENLNNQIEFITFHQNYSYEDFIQGLRPDTENGKDLSFEKKDGIFKRIADRALKNLEAANNPASAKKDFDLVFQELIQPLNDGDVEELEIKMKKSSFYITEVGEKSIEFRKNIGDSNHTLSINTLRKMYDKGENDIILGGLQPYYNPILELLLVKGKSQVTTVERKNYVIIIDEINRANISRVFGELITLIEEDKRSHGKIPMRVTLPSGDSFIVPSNLYIIGTMNTADKSISLLDIALRRRFEFVPMYPKTNIEGVNSPTVLETINTEIIKRKGHDFTIGHAYFMGENYSLEKTINNKVIPLLLEYFMNDEKEVATILKSADIEVTGWPMQMKTA